MKKVYIAVLICVASLCLYRIGVHGYTFYSLSQITTLGMLYLLSIHDMKSQRLPLEDLLIYGCISVVFLLLNADINVLLTLITCVIVSGLLLLISRFTAGGIGKGDIFVIGSCILLLGYEQGALLLIIAFILSGITGIFLLVAKGMDKRTSMPFIPFMLLGYMIILLI